MNVLILNGADRDDPVLQSACNCAETILRSVGYSVRVFTLRDMNVAWCRGCFDCWVATPGICSADDYGREVAAAFAQSSLTLWLTPVHFGGYGSTLKKIIDRLICLSSPFFMKKDGRLRKKPRYTSYPNLAVVGCLPAPDAEREAVFKRLVSRNALNLHVPAYTSAVLYQSFSDEQISSILSAMLAETGVLL